MLNRPRVDAHDANAAWQTVGNATWILSELVLEK
jgi:hypothetical protein